MPFAVCQHDLPNNRCLFSVIWGLLTAVSLMGCSQLTTKDAFSGESLLQTNELLKTPGQSAGVVTLDIYWAVLPPEAESYQKLWESVQEDRLDPVLRRRLASNGLRAGVVGAALPDEFVAILDPLGSKDKMLATDGEAAPLAKDTGVERRTRQLRPGSPIDLQASPLLESAPVLVTRNGELCGETYSQAQAFYRLSLKQLEAEQAHIELLPELRHGEARLRFLADETGMISRQQKLKPTETYDELAIAVPLAAGESLLVASLDDSQTRLGSYFHTATGAADGSRRAIFIRVSQMPSSGIFAAARE